MYEHEYKGRHAEGGLIQAKSRNRIRELLSCHGRRRMVYERVCPSLTFEHGYDETDPQTAGGKQAVYMPRHATVERQERREKSGYGIRGTVSKVPFLTEI